MSNKLKKVLQTYTHSIFPKISNTMSNKQQKIFKTKQVLKQSVLIQRLNEPMSTELIKQLSNPSIGLNSLKNRGFRIKKYESLESSSTVQEMIFGQQARFVQSFKNDMIFRKKVEYLIKQHEKRLKQEGLSIKVKSSSNNTWRTQKHSEEVELLEMYQKCKKWINRVNETR